MQGKEKAIIEENEDQDLLLQSSTTGGQSGLSLISSINQSKPVTPRRRFGTPTDASPVTAI